MPDPQDARTRLETALAELRQRLDHLDQGLSEPHDPDSAERAIEIEDDASLEAQAALVTREIGSIERALDRIAQGTYGDCVICGAEINPRRLEARPEASLCIDCARKEG